MEASCGDNSWLDLCIELAMEGYSVIFEKNDVFQSFLRQISQLSMDKFQFMLERLILFIRENHIYNKEQLARLLSSSEEISESAKEIKSKFNDQLMLRGKETSDFKTLKKQFILLIQNFIW